MNFARRSYDKELLEMDDVPFSDVVANLRELNTINTLLGGHRITQRGVNYFLSEKVTAPLVIAEIGCGGGDNLFAIRKLIGKDLPEIKLIGIDIKPECIEIAQREDVENITWICSDYRYVSWPISKPDIIFSSLFCHHFTDVELLDQLKWLQENAIKGFFINDLHRHPLAYYSIRLLTRLFSRSYLLRNDGPLSVMRAFKKRDWYQLMSSAGINNYQIEWQWAFRYLICVRNER